MISIKETNAEKNKNLKEKQKNLEKRIKEEEIRKGLDEKKNKRKKDDEEKKKAEEEKKEEKKFARELKLAEVGSGGYYRERERRHRPDLPY